MSGARGRVPPPPTENNGKKSGRSKGLALKKWGEMGQFWEQGARGRVPPPKENNGKIKIWKK